MAAWTEPQKTSIRGYMGASALFKLNFYPLLESCMTTVLAQVDGGDQPDDSTQLAIIATLAQLDDIVARETKLTKRLQVDTAETSSTKFRGDFARALFVLRSQGRVLANRLARHLGFTAVLADFFTASAPHVPPPIGPDLYSRS